MGYDYGYMVMVNGNGGSLLTLIFKTCNNLAK